MTAESWVLDAKTGPDTLNGIQRVLDDFFAAHEAVPDLVRMHLGIAAAEIGANIIAYAGGGEPIRLRMEVRLLAHAVQIVFTDDGQPAQVDLDSVAFPDDLTERGRGLPLALAVLDRLSYRRNAANHWTLVSQPI